MGTYGGGGPGANIRHGPHQEAHQSTSVIPGLVTVARAAAARDADYGEGGPHGLA